MKVRVSEAGIKIGKLPTGEKNCIIDVEGVMVGQITLDYPLDESGMDYACTGVTAILPHNGNIFREKVTAASYVINGYGKTTGLVQVNELGVLEAPIMLTNTFAVPAVTQGTLEYMLANNPKFAKQQVQSILSLVNAMTAISIRFDYFRLNQSMPSRQLTTHLGCWWRKVRLVPAKVWFASAIKEGLAHLLERSKSIPLAALFLVILEKRKNSEGKVIQRRLV